MPPATMRALALSGGFGIDHLVMEERPVPEPGPGQALVRMRAVSLNFRDLLMVRGLYNPRQPLPLVPCSDGAGEVVAVGPGVRRVGPGDRVLPCFATRWISGRPTRERLRATLGGPLDGTLAEYLCLDAEALVRAPDHLSFVEAACLPCAGLTAWTALFVEAGIGPGDTVLVQGSGGVSVFALQLARLAGATVIATTGSPGKADRLRELGAAHVLDYKADPDWGRSARGLTGGHGVDAVLDVGGAGTLAQSARAVRIGGFIALIGVLAGAAAPLDLLPILMGYVRVQGVVVGHRDGFEAMNRALAAAGLRPVVDRVFPFEESAVAMEHLASGAHFGKVCIELG